jgi:hypothetical protein
MGRGCRAFGSVLERRFAKAPFGFEEFPIRIRSERLIAVLLTFKLTNTILATPKQEMCRELATAIVSVLGKRRVTAFVRGDHCFALGKMSPRYGLV